MEIWRDIQGYEGLYQVSSEGRVKSLVGAYGKEREKVLKSVDRGSGYLFVRLCKDGIIKPKLVHRLVAEAFLQNPNNLQQVNHKDEDKTNNCVDNLEWCDASYNNNYGTRTERQAQAMLNGKLSTPVYQYDLNWNLVRIWPSTQECARNGYDQGNVWRCCKGKQQTHKGYRWSYNQR